MVGYCLVLSGVAHSIFYLRHFRYIIKDDRTRLVLCLLLSAMPVGNFAINTSTLYSSWHLYGILILLVWAPWSERPALTALQLLFCAAAVFSHPLSVLLLPICLVNIYRRRSRTDLLMNLALILSIGAYFLFGVTGKTGFRDVFGNSQENLTNLLLFFSDKVIAESILGNQSRWLLHLNDHSAIIHAFSIVVILALMAVTCFSVKPQRRAYLRIFLVSMFLILLTAACVLLRNLVYETPRFEEAGFYLDTGYWSQRYFFLQQYAFLALFLLALCSLQKKIPTRRIKLSAGVFLLAYVLFMNYQNRQFFIGTKTKGQKTIEFLRDIDRIMKRNPDLKGRRYIYDRGDNYNIIIIQE